MAVDVTLLNVCHILKWSFLFCELIRFQQIAFSVATHLRNENERVPISLP